MEDIFITKVEIKKVRHLENLAINLSETERKHLILTGRNGSGKTSVLEELKQFLTGFEDENNSVVSISSFEKAISICEGKIVELEKRLKDPSMFDNKKESLLRQKFEIEKDFQDYESILSRFKQVFLHLNVPEIALCQELNKEHKNRNFILSYFPAKRTKTLKL